MKILDLNDKLFKKALLDWVKSVDTMSPEEICIKIEEFLEYSKDKKAS